MFFSQEKQVKTKKTTVCLKLKKCFLCLLWVTINIKGVTALYINFLTPNFAVPVFCTLLREFT